MLLLLAEKANEAAAYVKALKGQATKKGEVYVVKDSPILPKYPEIHVVYLAGHVYELKEPGEYDDKWAGPWDLKTLPIFPEHMSFKLSPQYKRKRQVIVEEISKCDDIWLGTDSDVEGESIGYIFLQHNQGLKKLTGRLWQNSLTPSGLAKDFHHIRKPSETIGNAHAGYCRMVADWLIGFNYSRLATVILQDKGYAGTFSVGRVQTPTIKAVYLRRKARAEFKPSTSYRVKFTDSQGLQFDADKETGTFTTEAEAQQQIEALTDDTFTVTNVQKTAKTTSAPKLNVTSDFQAYMIEHAHISGKQALDGVLEVLYNTDKIISYPRTESHLIKPDDFELLKQNLPSYLKLYAQITGQPAPDIFHQLTPRKRYVDLDGKGGADTHSALILQEPCTYEHYQQLDEHKKMAYQYIMRSTLAIFADDYRFDQYNIDGQVGSLKFQSVSKLPLTQVQETWKSVLSSDTDASQANSINYDTYQQGTNLSGEYGIKPVTTQPPAAVTNSSLFKTVMPRLHLGTGATRADIVQRLFDTEYLISSKKADKDKNLKKGELIVTAKGLLLLELLENTTLADFNQAKSWQDQMTAIAEDDVPVHQFLGSIKMAIKNEVVSLPTEKHELTADAPKKKQSTNKNIKVEVSTTACPKCHKGKVQLITYDDQAGKHHEFYTCNQKKCKFLVGTHYAGVDITPHSIQEIVDGKYHDHEFIKQSDHTKTYRASLVFKRGKLTLEFPDNGSSKKSHSKSCSSKKRSYKSRAKSKSRY